MSRRSAPQSVPWLAPRLTKCAAAATLVFVWLVTPSCQWLQNEFFYLDRPPTKKAYPGKGPVSEQELAQTPRPIRP